MPQGTGALPRQYKQPALYLNSMDFKLERLEIPSLTPLSLQAHNAQGDFVRVFPSFRPD